MNKPSRLLLCFAMLAALSLICVFLLQYASLNRQYYEYERQLSESREIWEGIAAEKEALSGAAAYYAS